MTAKLHYQPELDGLRAVAITPVVFFHAGLPGFRGGFVGVDVFFVISGFLITRLLMAELTEIGSIDFLAFYARRIRRLLPALIAVIIVTLALGSFILPDAGERQDLSRSAIATVTFISNFYFWWSQASYFAPEKQWLPLLNMWTLSVEEQFYLVWPALLALAGALARNTKRDRQFVFAAMLVLLFVTSLAIFVWGAGAHATATYYMTPARVWEFTLGGAAALAGLSLRHLKRAGGLLALAGLIAIGGAVGVGWHGLPIRIVFAAIGAAAVIVGVSATPGSIAGRLLSVRPFVIVGKLSYSWYLWHWPLLALVRVYDFGQTNLLRDFAVICIAFGLAALTYVFIENPIRLRKPWPFSGASQAIAAAGGLSVATALLALVFYIQADAVLRRDPWLSAVYAAKSPRSGPLHLCHLPAHFSGLPPVQNCLFGATNMPPRILLWGDSHAEHYEEMIGADGARNGYAAIARSMSACPPLLAPRTGPVRLSAACAAFNAAVAEEIPALAQSGVTGLVLASRAFGLSSASAAVPAALAAWKDTLRATLAVAQKSHLRVLLIAPVPTWKTPVPECLARLATERCGLERAAVDQTRAPLVTALRQVAAEFDNAQIWDPIDSLCDDRVCLPVHDGVILVADRHHLTPEGSRSLQPAAAPYLQRLVH